MKGGTNEGEQHGKQHGTLASKTRHITKITATMVFLSLPLLHFKHTSSSPIPSYQANAKTERNAPPSHDRLRTQRASQPEDRTQQTQSCQMQRNNRHGLRPVSSPPPRYTPQYSPPPPSPPLHGPCRRRPSTLGLIVIVMAALAIALGTRSVLSTTSPSATTSTTGRHSGDDELLAKAKTTATDHLTSAPSPTAPVPRVSPSRNRVCRILHRLTMHIHDSSDPSDRSLGPDTPELFEYLGLDRSAPPFFPASDMALSGQPAHRAARSAIRKAWGARLSGLGVAGESPSKEMDVTAMKNGLTSKGGHRRAMDEEALIHTVARILWDDDTRGDYVKHVLPVLRPNAGSDERRPGWFKWRSAPAAAVDVWEILCPSSSGDSD
ncbi:hypothetical protein LZ30DRAFT_255174 [Colletotrichum cereale]|nr:hypothetical protein LZ30DRAFT_255174 [Colletotrichum cereale]